jgi:hypothetical protein
MHLNINYYLIFIQSDGQLCNLCNPHYFISIVDDIIERGMCLKAKKKKLLCNHLHPKKNFHILKCIGNWS